MVEEVDGRREEEDGGHLGGGGGLGEVLLDLLRDRPRDRALPRRTHPSRPLLLIHFY